MNVKAHASGSNKCQQLPTLLGVVGQQCCVRLHGPISNCTQQVPTSANIFVVPYKGTQQVTTLLGPTMLGVVVQQCWVRLHGHLEYKSFQSSFSFKNKASKFSYSHTFRQNEKENTNKKRENGKLKIQQASSLTFPSQLLKFPI